jgi:DHA1 family tetracycline resistance protein-like MFS transporter
VPGNEQGELQGALASIGGVTSIVAPVLLTTVFAYFTGANAPVYFPGSAFLAAGVMLALAALVIVRLDREEVPQAAE